MEALEDHYQYLVACKSPFPAPRTLCRSLIVLLLRLSRTLEQYLIHDAHLLGLMCHQVPVPLHHVIHRLGIIFVKPKRLVQVPPHDVVDLGAYPLDLGSVDDDVGGLALGAAQGLVYHDGAVREGVALAGLAAQQQDGGHGGGGADADGRHGRLDVGHGVVDGQPGADLAAGGVDVHGDRFLGGVGFEPQQLGHDGGGDGVVYGTVKANDSFLEGARDVS